MDRAELVSVAETLLSEYREILFLDPYFKIKVEVVEDDFISLCSEDSSPATWILKLNPNRHNDIIDIQLSVIDCLLKILARDLPQSKRLDEVLSKITHAVAQLLAPAEDETESVSEEETEDV